MSDKIIAVDFDGTVNSFGNGFIDWHIIDGPPLPNAKEILTRLKREGWTIIIHSVRSNDINGYNAIEQHLQKYEIPYDEIWRGIGKPYAQLYVDDVALKFEGDWIKTYNEIKNFKHWMTNGR